VCLRLSVLCCPAQVEALRRADPQSEESYQMSKKVQKANTKLSRKAKAYGGL
jgi:hypothetical protein